MTLAPAGLGAWWRCQRPPWAPLGRDSPASSPEVGAVVCAHRRGVPSAPPGAAVPSPSLLAPKGNLQARTSGEGSSTCFSPHSSPALCVLCICVSMYLCTRVRVFVCVHARVSMHLSLCLFFCVSACVFVCVCEHTRALATAWDGSARMVPAHPQQTNSYLRGHGPRDGSRCFAQSPGLCGPCRGDPMGPGGLDGEVASSLAQNGDTGRPGAAGL